MYLALQYKREINISSYSANLHYTLRGRALTDSFDMSDESVKNQSHN
jgi:hypothetical protein